MRNGNPLVLAFILFAAAAFAGCASTAAPCASESCQADAKTTGAVRAKIQEYRELGPPNSVYVQVRDGVVYLTGQVTTDLQRSTAETAAGSVPGVARVVNNISLSYSGR